jgi:hypothetical protein
MLAGAAPQGARVNDRRFDGLMGLAILLVCGCGGADRDAASPAVAASVVSDGSVLPFPPEPMAGVARPRLQDSTVKWPVGPGKNGTVTLFVDEKEVGKTALARTVPAAFTASETFDVGVDLGSTVGLDYYERRPFAFNGKINSVKVAND